MLYPLFMGFDEQLQLDRVYDVTGGQLIPTTGHEPVNQAIPKASTALFNGYPYGPNASWDHKASLQRDQRPSLSQLGGLSDAPPGGGPNQISQHPPLYFWIMGGAMALMPGHDTIPVDQLVFWLRLLNVVIMLPLPVLFWRGAAHLVGDGQVARAAAFLPLIMPALPRIGASINNDNLTILAGTATMVALAAVLMGDLSVRRGWYVAIPLAVALWCKATALFLCPLVLLCYLFAWSKVRGRFPLRPAIAVGVGAVVGLSWWVQNLIRYGTLQPNGFGPAAAAYDGPKRTSADPAQMSLFWQSVTHNFPTRFWGQLGEPEPPYLQKWILLMLTGILVAGLILSAILARGVRIATLLPWAFGAVALVTVIWQAMRFYQTYTKITGLQARYAFPMVFGLLVPIVVGFGALLRRHARWLSPGLMLIGTVVSIDSFFLWINRMLLPSGTVLTPGSVGRAMLNITRFFPFPTPVTYILVISVVGGGLWAISWLALLTVRSARNYPADGQPPEFDPSSSSAISTAAAGNSAGTERGTG